MQEIVLISLDICLFVSQNDYASGWHDQTTVNYLEIFDYLSRYNLHYSDITQPEPVVNLWNWRLSGSFGYAHAQKSTSVYATIIHHTHKNATLNVEIAKACPIIERNLSLIIKYFGKCERECYSSVTKYFSDLIQEERK